MEWQECLELGKTGLIVGIILGIAFGIALMAGWKRIMRYRSTQRKTKAAEIKLLGSLDRNDSMKICGENFPKWISFPIYEQVKWLNKKLSKLWPFMSEAAPVLIKESVGTLLDDFLPPGITSLKFSHLSLGSVAPKIEGIRVQSLKKGQITMDIDFRWGGDANIGLVAESGHASTRIVLKELKVFSIVRVIFQLAEAMPCVSAVVVSLLAEPKPKIDYILKVVGGSLIPVPRISHLIDDIVDSIVTEMLQWPRRIVVPMGGIPVDISELELKPHGRLTVTVMKANGLKNMELIGKSDPYVQLYIRPILKSKTQVVDNELNPVWDEIFDFITEDKETQSLILEIFDEDVGRDELLGAVKYPLDNLEPETEKELELRLMPSVDMMKIKDTKDRGTLTIKVFYHQFNKEEQLAALEEEKKLLEERRIMREHGHLRSSLESVENGASEAARSGVSSGTRVARAGKAVSRSLSRAGKLMSKSLSRHGCSK